MKTHSKIEPITANCAIRLSIIVPCYNEEAVLLEFHRRVSRVLVALDITYELLYINDGSCDNTEIILNQLCRDAHSRALSLSRNFGKEAAMSAGIDYARGEAIIFLDADLQDPPELIPAMVERWQAGFDIVNMQRSSRDCDTRLKRASARFYYWLMRRLNEKCEMPAEVSDFRLLGPKPLAALRNLPERSRMMKGLISWLGFKTVELPYRREAREAGETKWGYFSLIDLALEGVISFSRKPLRWFTFMSVAVFLSTFFFLLERLWTNAFTTTDLLLAMGAFLAVGISILGEYLGATISETKCRPHYLLANVIGDAFEQSPQRSQYQRSSPLSAEQRRELQV